MKKKTKPVKRFKREPIILVPKTIKFDPSKLDEATKKGRIRELAAMCREQLDILIAD